MHLRTSHQFKITLTLITTFVVNFLYPFSVLPSVAEAAFNEEINYQGKLLDSSGGTVADGAYHMKFRLYTQESGGSLVWEEERSATPGNRVEVTSGLFSTMLGSSTPLTNVDFNQELWLEVAIGGTASSSWETLSPRKRLGAVPAAFEAQNAQTVGGVASSSFVRSDEADTIEANTSSSLLTINQTGSGNILDLQDGGSSVFTVRDGGYVGIGTTSPSGILHVYGTNPEIYFEDDDGAYTKISQQGSNLTFTAEGNGGSFTFENGSGTDLFRYLIGQQAFVVDTGSLGVGTSSPYAKLSVTNTGTGPSFLVEDSASPDNSPFVIDASGNVSIGTFTSREKLLVQGEANHTYGTLGLMPVADNATSSIKFYGSTNTSSEQARIGYDGESNFFFIQTGTSNTSSNLFHRLTIGRDTGNVGIGTTNAQKILHVVAGEGDGIRVQNSVNGSFLAELRTDSTAADAKAIVYGNGGLKMLSGQRSYYETSGGGWAAQHVFQSTNDLTYAGSAGGTTFMQGNATWAPTTGTGPFYPYNFNFSVNQSGTATGGYTGLLVNVTESSFQGSVGKLIDLRRDSASYFNVDRLGNTYVAGNVGIGTSSPYAKLSVAGEVVASHFTGTSTATSTFGGGVDIASGCYAVNGTCIGGSSLTGSGAANRAAFWTASGSLSYDDSFVWDNTNKRLGIGTTTPSAPLSVKTALGTNALYILDGTGQEQIDLGYGASDGDAHGSPILRLNRHSSNSDTSEIVFSGGSSFTEYMRIYTPAFNDGLNSGAGVIQYRSANSLSIDRGANSPVMFFDSEGQVGIGTTSPNTPLHVYTNSIGSTRFRIENAGSLGYTGAVTELITDSNGRARGTLAYESSSNKNWFWGVPYGGGAFAVNYYSGGSDISHGTAQNIYSLLTIKESGNVGIGNVSPAEKLNVQGTVAAQIFNATSTTATSTFAGGLAVDTSGLVYDWQTNFVGIGTAGPTYPLDVDGHSGGTIAKFDSDASVGQIQVSAQPGTAYMGVGTGNIAYVGVNSGIDTDNIAINSAGSLGIGSTSPYARLSVTNTGTGPSFIVEDSTSPDSSPFIVDASGNVGIGTATPTNLLTLSGSLSSTPFSIKNGSTNRFQITLDGSGNTLLETRNSSRLGLGVNGSEALSVISGGNVGIGTTTPESKLQINAPAGGEAIRLVPNGASNYILSYAATHGDRPDTFGFNLSSNPSDGNEYFLRSNTGGVVQQALYLGHGDAASENVFGISVSEDTGTSWTPYLVANYGGNIGIGTTSPATKLSVAGSGYLTGGLGVGVLNSVSGTAHFYSNQATLATFERNNAQNAGVQFKNTVGSFNAGINPSGYFGIGTSNNLASAEFIMDTGGNVGIGTTSPYAKLSVTNTGTGPSFLVEDSASPDSTPFIIDASGNVGIGDTAPSSLLSLSGPADYKIFFKESNTSAMSLFYEGSAGSSVDNKFHIRSELGGSNTKNLMTFVLGGNVGIGTSSPYAKLSVAGEVVASHFTGTSTATSTFGGGLNLLTGCLAYNSTCIDLTASGNVNSGTQGQIAYYAANGTAVTGTSSVFISTAGNVGIGDASPAQKLDVAGHIRMTGSLFYTGSNGVITFRADGGSWTGINARGIDVGISSVDPNYGVIESGATYDLKFNIDGSNKMTILDSGNVGIGTTNPSEMLTMVNTATSTLLIQADSDNSGGDDGSENAILRFATDGAVTGWDIANVNNSGSSLLNFSNTSAGDVLTLTSTGNVGIGNDNPAYKLDVSGDVLFGNADMGSIVYFSGKNGTSNRVTFDNQTDADPDLFIHAGANRYLNITNTDTGTLGLTVEGRVGIGQATPEFTLDIKDTLKLGLTEEVVEGVSSEGVVNAYITATSSTDRKMQLGVFDNLYTRAQIELYNGNTGSGEIYLKTSDGGGSAAATRLTVAASGNVGIGTTSPYAKLSVTNTGTGPSFLVEDSTSPDSTPFIIDASGNVGVGISNPLGSLSVEGTDGTFPRFIAETSGSAISLPANYSMNGRSIDGLEIYAFRDSSEKYVDFVSSEQGGFTESNFRFFTTNTSSSLALERMRIDGNGNVGIGSTSPSAKLAIEFDDTTAGEEVGLRIDVNSAGSDANLLLTSDDGVIGAGSDFMRWESAGVGLGVIQGDGSFGIGNAAPKDKLHLTASNFDSSTGLNGLLIEGGSAGSGNYTGGLSFMAAGSIRGRAAIAGIQEGSDQDLMGLAFFTHSSANFTDPLTEAMRITNSGNVGIGTTSPYAKLSVAGEIVASHFTGTSTATSTFGGGLNLLTGCLAYNSTCIDLTASGNVNSGTQGQIAYYAANGTAVTGTSSVFISTAGNVGIGSTNPTSLLQVNGEIKSYGASNAIRLDTGSTDKGDWKLAVNDSGSDGLLEFQDYSGATWNTNLAIASSGNVGIGTSSPSAKLTVDAALNGTAGLAYFLNSNADDNDVEFIALGQSATADDALVIGYNETGNYGYLNVWGEAAGDGLVIANGGNIGIGTTTPQGNLSISGTGVVNTIFDSSNSSRVANAFQWGGATKYAMFLESPDASLRFGRGASYANEANVTMTLDAAGRVGIGTTTPSDWLTVQKGSSFGQITIASGNTNDIFGFRIAGQYGNGRDWRLEQGRSGAGEFNISDCSASCNQRLVINSSGNVGISSSSPHAKLSVTNTGSMPSFIVEDSTSPDDTRFIIDNSGLVGVGQLANLTERLNVGDSGNVFVRVDSYDNSGNAGIRFEGAGDRGSVYGTSGYEINIEPNAQYGQADVIINPKNGQTTRLGVLDTTPDFGIETIATSSNGYFGISSSASGDGDIFAVDLSGNVGIGTAAPGAKLEIEDSSSIPFIIERTGATAPGTMRLGRSSGMFTGSGNGSYLQSVTDSLQLVAAAGSFIAFGDGTTENMRIDGAGNVGIGVSSPQAILDVKGNNGGTNSLLLRSGNSSTGTSSNQILFGYNNSANYSHAIKTRHHSGAASGNAIDFYLWDYSADAEGTPGTKHVMTLNGGGYVGIGTTNPTRLLEVEGTARVGSAFIVDAGSGNSNATLSLVGRSGGTEYAAQIWSDYTGGLDFKPASGRSYSFRRGSDVDTIDLEITSIGNVGIGTSSPYAKLTVTNDGSNPSLWIEDQSGDTTPFVIDASGWVGIGTTTPSAALAVNGSIFASSTATSTFLGSFVIDGGKFSHDYVSGETSISNLNLGPMRFDNNAGWVSWIDLPVTSGVATGTAQAYTAQIDTLDALTIWAETADDDGTLTDLRVVVGQSSASVLSSSNIPYGSLMVANGALCVDNTDNGADCDNSARNAGYIYAEGNSVSGLDLAENYPYRNATVTPGMIVAVEAEDAQVCETWEDQGTGAPVCVEYRTESIPFVVPAARTAGTQPLIGVVSTEPGVTLGGFDSKDLREYAQAPVALAGRVPVIVTDEGGEIKPGDRIALSTEAGLGMKATTTGYTVGIALDAFDGTTATGSVLMFVDLAYYTPPLAQALDFITTQSPVQESWFGVTLTWIGTGVRSAVASFDRLFAGVITADRVETRELCVGQVCVTESQFLQMVQQAGATPAATSTPQAPTITTDSGSGSDTDSTASSTATTTPTVTDSGDTDDAATTTASSTPATGTGSDTGSQSSNTGSAADSSGDETETDTDALSTTDTSTSGDAGDDASGAADETSTNTSTQTTASNDAGSDTTETSGSSAGDAGSTEGAGSATDSTPSSGDATSSSDTTSAGNTSGADAGDGGASTGA